MVEDVEARVLQATARYDHRNAFGWTVCRASTAPFRLPRGSAENPSGVSSLTLLLGSLAVIRGRRILGGFLQHLRNGRLE